MAATQLPPNVVLFAFILVSQALTTVTPTPSPFGVWEIANRAAIIAGVFGIPLTLWGLYIAIREARFSAARSQEAKTASEAAQQAVGDFRRDLRIVTTVAEFTKALSITGEIKRLVRHRAFVPLPDRLSEMRELLISIRGNNSLTDEQESIFQSAIVNFRTLETRVDSFISTKSEPIEIADINEVISQDVDALQAILSTLKNQIGVNPNDT